MEASPATNDVGVSRVLIRAPASEFSWWNQLQLGPGLRFCDGRVGSTITPGSYDVAIGVGPDGAELLRSIRAADPDCVRIFDPADPHPLAFMAAINHGLADRLWTSGHDPAAATELIRDAVEDTLLRRHNRALLDELGQRNAELLDFTSTLERVVEERTGHLREAHQRLQSQQQAMLRLETHGMLTHLARGLAHELNNPLAAILGFAQRLRRHATDDDTRRRLQVILDEVERCRQLVDQIRRLAAPLDEAIVAVDPAEALERAKARRQEGGRPLPAISIHGTLPRVLAAPEALARVLEEGLDNAVWAGARAVVMAGETDGSLAHLTLANDGATPSADDAFNATKPFFTTRSTAGAQGLGLAVAAGLMREQDGHLELQPGRFGGAVLKLHLPSITLEKTQAAVAVAAASGTILVVDDQPLVAELLTDLLQELGFTVRTASDVAAALAAIEAEPVTAVLTDLHLPDGSGQDLARRATRLRPELQGRVAVITGDPEAAGQALPVLAKPFRAEQVDHLLKQLFGQTP